MIKGPACFVIGILATLVLFSAPVQAETLVLTNGDRLTGKIVSENDSEIVFRHHLLGVLKIPKNELASRLPEKQKNPADQNADMSVDAAVESVKAASKGEAEILKSNTSAPAPPPTATRVAAKAQPKKMTPKLFGLFSSHFIKGWKRHLAFGFGGEDGDDQSTEWNVGIEASYKDESDRIGVSGAYFYETEDHEKDTSKGHLNLTRDWLLSDTPWFYYGNFLYEYDYFKSWKQRYTVSGGTGYDFINRDDLELRGRMGLGLSRSFGNEDNFETEGQLGMEWSWNPAGNKKHLLSFRFLVHPILNDLGEYRTWCQGKWKIDLGLYKGLGVEMGFEHEYESQLDIHDKDDEKYYDLIYFGRLGLDF